MGSVQGHIPLENENEMVPLASLAKELFDFMYAFFIFLKCQASEE